MNKYLKRLSIAAVMAGMGVASNAATVNFTFGGNTIFSVDCALCASGDILGWQATDENDVSLGGAFALTGTAMNPVVGNPSNRNPSLAGPAEEIDFVNLISGESYDAGDFMKDETGNVPASVSGEYILFKSGDYAGVLQNLSGGALALTYTQVATGAGLSHVSELGQAGGGGGTNPNPVPLPAGLPMLVGALGLTGLVMRRRKTAA